MARSDLDQQSVQSGFPPRILLFVAISSLFAAIILNTTVFPKLGPPPERLTSEIDSVRWLARVTLFEIAFVRALLALVGIAALAAWLKWSALVNSQLVQTVRARRARPLGTARTLNGSFFVMAGTAAAFLIWVAIAGLIPAAMPAIVVIEDGLVEYATALLFIPASFLAFSLAFREHQRQRRIMLALLGLFFFVCVGEEISWGQRILEFGTPPSLQAINVQGEANLHNSFGYAADHIFRTGVLLYCVLMPLLAHRYKFFHRLFDHTGLPIGSIGLAVGFAIAGLFENWFIYAILPETTLRLAEVREFLSSLGFLLLMLETRHQLVRMQE